MPSLPIHPFPARMAPDIALTRCLQLPANAVVLDPMVGSGTVLRAAVDAGLQGIGYDVDPLAVLMTRVWTTPIDIDELREAARNLVRLARAESPAVRLAWVDDDLETREFVNFWYAPKQQEDLRRLSVLLARQPGHVGDALRIALSRLIVTKDRGASLARDVSHSRPHRVGKDNDFDVFPALLRSVDAIAPRLISTGAQVKAAVKLGDARCMNDVLDGSVDAIITSPPYLNAIDYIRGHRLALVWLGYQIGDLRSIRATSVGAERAPERDADRNALAVLLPALGQIDALPTRVRGMVDRYLIDLFALLQEIRRALKTRGTATLVVGNSRLHNVLVDNAAAVTVAASTVGLTLMGRRERELPPSRRYLPPPKVNQPPDTPHRMRTEVVLTFLG